MWRQAALCAALAFAGLAVWDGPKGARATESPAPLQAAPAPSRPFAPPSLADAVSALSISQRQTSSLATAAVASDLAKYLTVGARGARRTETATLTALPITPARAAVGATALGGLIDAGDALGVVIPFGAQGRNGRLTRGMTVGVSAGGGVYAPFDGVVGYAGPLDGYGDVVILLGPAREALVITGLAGLRVREGQSIALGAPLGAAPGAAQGGDRGDSLTSSATQAPELYLEVRQDGRFIDPAQWLRERN